MNGELAIIIPTYNERENIQAMVRGIDSALQGIDWEIIFVDDDSPDGTAAAVRSLGQIDRRVRCLQRLNRKGLASACIEGMLASSSPYIAVMDADMQHDEGTLPRMLSALKNQPLDIVIGSRYIQGGSTGNLSPSRVWISRVATGLSRLVLHRPISDPMSGFFMLRRSFFEGVMRKLSGRGFKILLDILVSAGSNVSFSEQPYNMRSRTHGESKLGATVIWEYFMLLLYKGLGRIIPSRFLSFATVGCSGILVNIFFLWIFHQIYKVDFVVSQAVATFIAMTSNYILNNLFTFHDRKLAGTGFFTGLLSFYLACTLGAIINVAVADMIYMRSFPWWLAGGLGAVAGAVWNYAVSATFTWRVRDGEGE